MADRKRNPIRPNPDELENPTPRVAPTKTVVDTVLNAALAAGNGVVSLMAGLLAGVLVLYSGYVLYDTFSTQYNAYSSAWDLLQYKPEYITDGQTPLGANALEDINADYRAWLTVYDTSIDYPVVQGEDDLYYAWHNIYKQSSLTGAIYLASQNSPDFSDSYNLIYGHHMDNGAMFGRLDSYRDAEFYAAHRNGIVVTSTGAFDVRLFAVAVTDAYEEQIYTVGNRSGEVLAFLESGGEGGAGIGTELLQFDADEAAGATRILALSTCASADTSGRLVVFGRMTRRDTIDMRASGYEGVYDGQPHGPAAEPSLEDAALSYSIDGGETWTEVAPTITDVGELTVLIRAESPVDGAVEHTVTLRVLPRPVTVAANDARKVYGASDPELTANVTGLLDGDGIDYVLDRAPGEAVGSYPITPSGEASQGNYIVTYVPGTLTILKAGELRVTATGYTGVVDGKAHRVTASVNISEGTILEYSVDGGATWTTTIPSISEAGEIKVLVRAVNPNYETATATALLKLTAQAPETPQGNDDADRPAARPTAGPEPEPETISLTIRKLWQNDDESTRPSSVSMVLSGGSVARTVRLGAGNDWTATVDGLPAGVEYTWSEPTVSGYIQVTMTEEDGETTVVNAYVSRQTAQLRDYSLTVRYEYLDGTQAAPTYSTILREGEAYRVDSPAISGYRATPVRVQGTMPGRNVEYTVLYVQNEAGEPLEVIADYGTPLGVNGVYAMKGDCFE